MKWPMFPLDKIADVFGGSTPRRNRSEYWNGEIPWVTPTDLPKPGTEISDVYDTADHITPEGLRSCAAKLLPVGTVLYSSRATIGKIGIAHVPLATNQGFANFTPKPGVESKYLAYALQYFTVEISLLAGSTTFKEVRRGAFKKYKVPLPSPSEQRRIVEILDQADALRKKRAEADAKAARILPALFYKMFGDPVTNPMGWPKRKLGDLCRIVSGATPRTNVPEYWNGEIPWVTPKDLSPLKDILLEKTERKISQAGFDSCSTVMLPEGSVLLSSRAPIGLVAIAGMRVCTNQGFKSFVCGEDVNPWYLFAWLKTNVHYLNALGRGATFKEISQTIVRSIEIPVPDRTLQNRFANCLRNIRKAMLAKHTVQDKLERIFASLLHRAFMGELTAKWREAHMKELLAEMEQQAKALETPAVEKRVPKVNSKRHAGRRAKKAEEKQP